MGEIRCLEDHLQLCDYTKLPCPRKCQQNKIFRKDLQKHLKEECPSRQHICPHCNETGKYSQITGPHLLVCPKMKISCLNHQCKAVFLREDRENHLSACQYKRVSCKYKEFGCEFTALQKDIDDHEIDDTAHLHITMDTVLALNKQYTKLVQETVKLQEQIQLAASISSLNHSNSASLTLRLSFKMSEFAAKKEEDADFFSVPFFTHHHGYKMTICIDPNGNDKHKGTHTSVWVYVLKGEYDSDLEFPFKGTITIELLNQLEDKHHHKGSYTYDGTEDGSKRVTDRERAKTAYGSPAFIPHGELGFNAAKNCQYLKDDCLVFRIYAEVPSYKPWLQCTTA